MSSSGGPIIFGPYQTFCAGPANSAMDINVIRPPKSARHVQNLSSFKYDALPTSTSIRLLRVEALENLRDDLDLCRPLNCTMITQDLIDLPQYDALSYTWGDPVSHEGQPKEMLSEHESWSIHSAILNCNDRQLAITPNLHSALLAMRYYNSSRDQYTYLKMSADIWVDQICIDQKNVQEKNAQVSLMSQIYRQAQSVQVWLGGYNSHAADMRHVLDHLEPFDFTRPEIYQSFRLFERQSYTSLGICPISPEQWRGALMFLCRKWFRRSWIVQEVVLASKANIFFGLHAILFSQFSDFCIFLDDSKWINQILADMTAREQRFDFNKIFFKSIAIARYRMGTRIVRSNLLGRTLPPPFSLVDLTRRFRSLESTDPRDKVYAFLSLSREFANNELADLTIDYGKSISDIYIETTRLFMSSPGWNLACFSQKEDESRRQIKFLPTWVPDFSVAVAHNPLVGTCCPWTAGIRPSSGQIQHLPDNAIQIEGARVDRIRFVHRLHDSTCSDGIPPKNTSSVQILELISDGLIKLLRLLPIISVVPEPRHSNTAWAESFDRYGLPVIASHSTRIVDAEKLIGAWHTNQSRSEVLWRTLLQNLQQQYPAPSICGEVIFKDMEDLLYLKMAMKMTYFAQKRRFPGTMKIDWQLLTAEIGREYTDLQILKGLHPYESDTVLYPEGFRHFMSVLGKLWNRSEDRVDEKGLEEYCDFIQRKSKNLYRPDAKRTEVRGRILASTMGRALFATDRGRIGMGLSSTCVGDEVWVLTGSPVPCLLRSTGDGRYRLVGEAYVHGMMHGEGLSGLARDELSAVILI